MIMVVPCWADKVDEQQWTCQASGDLKGFHAFGGDLLEARRNLAEVLALAVKNHVLPDDVDGIRLMMTTRKTFSLTELLDNTV